MKKRKARKTYFCKKRFANFFFPFFSASELDLNGHETKSDDSSTLKNSKSQSKVGPDFNPEDIHVSFFMRFA
jgi:hypothetical protein